MKIESQDKNLLFSQTNLPNIFFTEYLSEASGDFIKVYLYLFFLAQYNKDIRINDLSKILNIPFNTIKEALNYWGSKGLLIKKGNGYILVDLQEKELNDLYSPKLTSSPEKAIENSKNQLRAKAIEEISNSFFQGMMPPTWYNDIDLWFKKYGFDEQVMIALFRYCFDRSALHRNYVQTVAEAWHQNKIQTYTELDNYFAKQDQLSIIENQIKKKLGYMRPFTQFESGYIRKWVVDYSYPIEIIDMALKKTTSKSTLSFDYIDKIISNWHDRNLKSVGQITEFNKQYKIQLQNKQALQKQTQYNTKQNYNSYSNYDQRQYDDLDQVFADNS